jgi:predicted nuclease of predicted toxin-antitoxin system
MKIKLDENLPDDLAPLFAAGGHDVQTVPQEQLAGRDDAVIFKAACDEERVLWTQDLDFSDVRTFSPGTHPGVVLMRLREPSRRRLVERVRQILASESLESWN